MMLNIIQKYFLLIFFLSSSLKQNFALKYDLTSGKFLAEEIKINDDLIVHRLSSIPYANVPFAFEKATLKVSEEDFTNETNKKNLTRKICIEASIFFNLLYGNLQPEANVDITFDCLRVDIYIPFKKHQLKKKRKNLTVLFFIHGGSNASGTSSTFDGSALAAYGDVIVVIPNYRLDVMGFFHSEENNIHGNYGLHDQVTALEWLDANCENLGCNRKSITVFGHSAGAADAMFLGMSSKSQVYINRIIVQSGSALAQWAIDNYEMEAENRNWEKKMNSLSKNFIQVTTCTHTLKYKCLKSKLARIIRIYSKQSWTPIEDFFIKLFKELYEKHDHIDIMEVVNYINDIKKSSTETNYNLNDIDSSNFLNNLKFKYNKNEQASRGKRDYFDEFFKMTSHSECITYFENHINDKAQPSMCKFVSIFNQTNLASLNLNQKTIINNSVIKALLDCFSEPYEFNDKIDNDVVINELKICTNDAINEFINHQKKSKNEFSPRKVINSINEIGALVKKETMLYTPVVDRDLIIDNPFRMLNNDKFLKTDIMVGVTAEECFYMLDHNYPLTDVLESLIMQSKNLNLTSNTAEKLKHIRKSKLMRECLKENIYSFYEKLYNNNSNKKSSRIKEEVAIMSDYEIKLPFINFLKLRAEHLHKQNFSKLFVYEFEHVLSFNFLLEEAIMGSQLLNMAYKHFNKSVSPHHTELDFVFGLPMLSKSSNLYYKSTKYNYSDIETKLSILVIKYWTNFAKYG
jgi:carboxylesterase type B